MSARQNGQRVAGAALAARVVRQLRGDLAASYGLPMDEYTAEVAPLDPDFHSLMLFVSFKRKDNGAEIKVDGIYVDHDGNIMQHNFPELG